MERNVRKLPCPHCGTIGTITMDASAAFRCTQCNAANFNPYENRTKVTLLPSAPDPRPPIPEGISQADVVEDYFERTRMDGNTERILVSKTYCPKPPKDSSEFDPETPAARRAFKAYSKRFKNRRRYDRDIKRRRGGLVLA